MRRKLLAIARKDVGKVEAGKNQGDWIKKLWPATSYPNGYKNKEPYCAAGVAYVLREWLKLDEVLDALGLTVEAAEKWRCKSARVFDWPVWAKNKGVKILAKDAILHVGDIVVFSFSHIEIVTDDDGTSSGKFTAIGYNTDAAGSREGDGCWEKSRSRAKVQCFIRILP